jgi:hypothetical protein
MILRANPEYLKKNLFQCHSTITNLTLTNLGYKPRFRDANSATKHLSVVIMSMIDYNYVMTATKQNDPLPPVLETKHLGLQ